MFLRGTVEGGDFVRVGEHSIYFETHGAGEPLLLIHGLAGSGLWWARNVQRLAEHRRVYLVDLPGFGRSRSARGIPLIECATFLTRWMDALNIQRASMIGHSMGGGIAAGLAADYPERVDRLILVNAAALPTDRLGLLIRIGSGRAITSLSPSFLPLLAADSLRAGSASLLGGARDVLSADIQGKLAEIRAPTLVVWGKSDRLLPVSLGHDLSAAIPDARLHVIERAGHNPMWDRPSEFDAAALRFLDEPPTTTRARDDPV
jgi:pimeloyl-ACP methyl ester carboxylesterase